MEDKTPFMESLFESAEVYGKVSYKLLQLRALDKAAGVIASLISRSTSFIFVSVFFVCANIGMALWLGDLLGKSYYGFFCVAGFYGLIAGILHFFLHNPIKRWISNSIISQALD
jgi:ABC-type uncharacterized transport system permease subunit